MSLKVHTEITHCRLCKNTYITPVISLGEQQITSRFPQYGDFSTPKTPIDLVLCEDCGLLQLLQTTTSTELYEHEYGYRSGISNTMREHLRLYQEDVVKHLVNPLQKGDAVLDIGSNDATTLRYYPSSIQRIGFDPTGEQFREYYSPKENDEEITLVPTYFTLENWTKSVVSLKKCKVVSSISMFYDLPDPLQFAKDIHAVLTDDGIWTCEQSYVATMLKTNSMDTICHEHLEYYSLAPIKEIADRAQLKIIDIQLNSCNGGSIRIYFAKDDSPYYCENTELVQQILNEEVDLKLKKPDTYFQFMTRCLAETIKLKQFLKATNEAKQKTYIYGASTKGNCLLQYADITECDIPCAVERNPKKIGKMTITGSRIIGEEEMRENPPTYLLVLPWHFRDEIIQREDQFLEEGGSLLFPFPQFEIYTKKQKVLITGSDGHIAHYVKERYSQENYKHNKYDLYGISRTELNQPSNDIKIPTFRMDMTNTTELKQTMILLKPDIIIHLAGLTSSLKATEHPPTTMEMNSLLIIQICEIIREQGFKTRVFNASSSEIYKGHVNYCVEDGDTHYFHTHPYSIAKIAGHSMVNYYRDQLHYPFSNGIIFTTESRRKSTDYLLNKVAQHVRLWKQGKTDQPLCVGNLDSFRNILHTSDVADAIFRIMEQPIGDTYVIANTASNKIQTMIYLLFHKANIKLHIMPLEPNVWIDDKTNLPILIVEDKNYDIQPTNITGNATKLKGLGWKPQFGMEHLIDELLFDSIQSSPYIRYVSSGKFGDFIQSLSVIKEKYIETGRKGILYIAEKDEYFRLSLEPTYKDTFPILSTQSYIQEYKIYRGEEYDINLSEWRCGHPYFFKENWNKIYEYSYNVSWGKHPWLELSQNKVDMLKNTVFLNIPNYCPFVNININAFYEKYGSNLVFISMNKNDYTHFKIRYPHICIDYYQVSNFTDMCIAVHSCKLFVGSLSGMLTIAHALHHPRVISLFREINHNDDNNDDHNAHNKGFDTLWSNVYYSLPSNMETNNNSVIMR